MYLRERFPIFESTTYLNSCSYAPLSTDVRAAYEQYLDDRDKHGSQWEQWVGMLEDMRAGIARVLNAEPDEMAITSSLSEGLNGLASALDFSGDRNKIVVCDFDFPTTAQIWYAQEKRGAEIVRVAADAEDRTLPLANFEKVIDAATLLVSVPYVCYRNGACQDLQSIIRIAHKHGAFVFVDCYQAVGAIPIDVKALDVDFLAGGMLKYLLSTAGTGFLYVRGNLIDMLEPVATGWFAQSDINAMDITRNNPSSTARRFESGTPNVANIYAAIAGLKLIEQLGVANIQNDVSKLTTDIKNRAEENGFKLVIAKERHGPMITLKSKDVHTLVAKLTEDRIITSSRDGNLRISPHFYNNHEDIERLFAGLLDNRNLMA